MTMWTWLDGVVVRGHGIASGTRGCQDIGGSIKAQRASFESEGIDLRNYYDGTVNVDIAPFSFVPIKPFKTALDIKWHSEWPAADFFFFKALLELDGRRYEGLVYYPRPDTKPLEFLGHSMLELLLPRIDKMDYGRKLRVAVDPAELAIEKNPARAAVFTSAPPST